MTLTAVPEAPARESTVRWWRLAPIEARLLMRRRTTLLGLLSGPVVMIGFGLLARPSDPGAWGLLAGLASLVGMLIAVYTTAATVFTMRRETGALARLRTTELTGPGIVAGSGTPLLVAGVGQALLVCGVYLAVGAPFPANPVLLLAALLLGGVFCVAAGAFTATVSRSVEGVQYTVAPLLLAAAVAANLLASGALPAPLAGALLLVPGVPIADLVQRAWSGASPLTDVAGVPTPAVGLALLALWTGVAVLGAAARWRWTPRG